MEVTVKMDFTGKYSKWPIFDVQGFQGTCSFLGKVIKISISTQILSMVNHFRELRCEGSLGWVNTHLGRPKPLVAPCAVQGDTALLEHSPSAPGLRQVDTRQCR